MNNKIWVIGAGPFGIDVAIRFNTEPGLNNRFCGFIETRSEQSEHAKDFLSSIGIKCQIFDPINFDFELNYNKYLFGIADPLYKRKFFFQYIKNFDKLHRFEQSPSINPYSNTNPGQYWGCNISTQCTVGYGNFIDANSVIGHNVTIKNFCHIGVGVIISGDVVVEDSVNIHSGAIIGKGVTIGKNSVIGSGSVILRNVKENTTIIAPKSIKIL